MSFVNAVFALGPAVWLIVAVILFGLETIIPGLHLLWFALAALATAALGFAFGIEWQTQIAAFAVFSIAAMFAVRRFASISGNATEAPTLNQPGGEYQGRIVLVEEPIRGGRGKVRVGDTLWIAEGPESPAGTRVRIKGTSGSVLLVERE